MVLLVKENSKKRSMYKGDIYKGLVCCATQSSAQKRCDLWMWRGEKSGVKKKKKKKITNKKQNAKVYVGEQTVQLSAGSK